MDSWDPRYDTLSRLDGSSLFLIGNRLDRFLDLVRSRMALTWPVDCFRLVRDISNLGIARMEWREAAAFSPGFEAATVYDPAGQRYLIILRHVPDGWKSRSPCRRCNFTVAHELGHIFLGHLEIPDGKKTDAWRKREDDEADEFASRLLMPEEMMRSFRFPSPRAMAAALLVSEAACFTRMNNLRLLDRLRLPPPVCPECGNRKVSPWASWCRMCGASLGYTVPEEAAMMMEQPRVSPCPVCGSDTFLDAEGDCPDCGQRRDNPCQAEYDQARHPNPPDARFCEICGAETLYAQLARTPFAERGMPLWKTFCSPAGK